MSKPTTTERRPLSEVQNVQQIDGTTKVGQVQSGPLKPSVAPELPIVKDQTMIKKKDKESAIPKPKGRQTKTSTLRSAATGVRTATAKSSATSKTSSGVTPGVKSSASSTASATNNARTKGRTNSVSDRPPVARRAAKPQPHVYSTTRRFNDTSNREHQVLDSETRRRTMGAKMNFTHGMPSSRTVSSNVGSAGSASRSGIPNQNETLQQIHKSTHLLLGKIDKLEQASTLVDSEASRKLVEENAVLLMKHQECERRATSAELKLGSFRDQLDEARQEHERLQMLHDSAKAKLERLDQVEADLATARADSRRAESVQKDLSDALDKLHRLERELDAVRHDRDNTKCELAASTKSLRQAEHDTREERNNAERAHRDAEDAIRQRDEAREENSRLTQARSERDAQISSLTDALKSQESRSARVVADKSALAAQLDMSREDAQHLREEIEGLKKEKEELIKESEELQSQAREDAKHRRKLHNMIQELKGNIRVFCRVRPPTGSEAEQPLFEYTEKGQGVVARTPPKASDDNSNVPGSSTNVNKKYPFKFDKVFDPSSSQATVFEEISELVQSALDGYRVCIFAYGQTGSGKTYTMLGQPGAKNEALGMIPRAVRQVFESAKAMEKDEWSFTLQASFLEIYNEDVRDLLSTKSANTNGSKTGTGKNGSPEYRITFDPNTKLCTVSDVTITDVHNEEQLQKLIERSMRNRTTAATKANERSSRSHSIFRLRIMGHNSATGQDLDGLLNLIDLAGSERLAHSKAEGDRLRETRHINKSLSALGDVIASLANKEKHVPFRNSKLTHLLQDSLGGDCKTLMFVNISHAPESFNESVCSLRFAAKVNSCHVGTAQRTAKIDLRQ